MALVTVTGNVTDITGKADPDTLVFTTPTIRKNVLSTRDKRVVPDSATGEFSVQLEAGPATVIVRGKPYKFVAAEGDLWSLIELNLSVPAATAAEKLQAAVNSWAQAFADGKYAAKSALASVADAVTAKYTKPADGVPKGDLATGVRTSLDKADASLSKTAADAAYAPLPTSPGTTGQVLTKTSGGTAWQTPTASGGSSLTDDGTGLYAIGTGSNLTDDGTGLYLIGA